MKIAVVGSGAVGCYYGGMLAHSGQDVHFLMRSDFEKVREAGLIIHTRGEEIHLRPLVHRRPEEIGPVDLVLIALKATANAELEHLIPPLLSGKTVLLTLQNGLGNDSLLAEQWGANRVMGGLCFVCINRTAPGVIHHLDHGSISIGEFLGSPQPRTHEIAEAFRAASLQVNVVENLATERWRKLLWNIPFNGLSIAAGANVAEILADDGLRNLARDLMIEALDAARREGHEIPDSFVDWQIERSYSMGGYKPSSMIDRELGRPVEVEAIWGEPLRRGSAASAEMPRLTTLYRLIRYLSAVPQS